MGLKMIKLKGSQGLDTVSGTSNLIQRQLFWSSESVASAACCLKLLLTECTLVPHRWSNPQQVRKPCAVSEGKPPAVATEVTRVTVHLVAVVDSGGAETLQDVEILEGKGLVGLAAGEKAAGGVVVGEVISVSFP